MKMTSKEAIRYLTKALDLEDYPTGTEEDYLAYDYAFGCLQQLEKDLKLLDILKKHISIFDTVPKGGVPDLIILQGGEISLDEARIINKWLKERKNDK